MKKKIPVVYAYIYYRIKKNVKAELIPMPYVKETISRIIVRDGGFPRRLVKYIVMDLIRINLIKFAGNGKYLIMNNDCDKRINELLSF